MTLLQLLSQGIMALFKELNVVSTFGFLKYSILEHSCKMSAGEANQIGEILKALYLSSVRKRHTGEGSRSAEGHKFEDETSQQIYNLAQKQGLEPNPPRMTLQLPTISGNLHQFDASFRSGNCIFVIECKNTRTAAKDYVYYFNAKILDYLLAKSDGKEPMLRGIFLCLVPLIKSAWLYSLAYGMRVVDPASPPIEYMIEETDDETLKTALTSLLIRVNGVTPTGRNPDHCSPSQLLSEYRFLSARWTESYGSKK